MDVNTIYLLLKDDLEAVQHNLETVLLKDSTKYSRDILQFIISSKGKYIRPILVFLAAYSFNPKLKDAQYSKLVDIATAVELIHTASLIHDDVIDNGRVRRNLETVNLKYGVETAVTMGVYLYSVSLQLIAKTEIFPILDELSVTVRLMCEGELYQQSLKRYLLFTEKDYFNVIESKTSVLFKAACLSGAYVVEASIEMQQLFSDYALNLGCAFQLIDDFLDVFGDDVSLQKEGGQDFLQGQLTLPLIYALDDLPLQQRQAILHKIKEKDISGLDDLRATMNGDHVKERLLNIITAKINMAKKSLVMLNKNEFTDALSFLSDYVLGRLD